MDYVALAIVAFNSGLFLSSWLPKKAQNQEQQIGANVIKMADSVAFRRNIIGVSEGQTLTVESIATITLANKKIIKLKVFDEVTA